MVVFDSDEVAKTLSFPALISALEQAFASDIDVPARHHHNFPNPDSTKESTLLLMPAWDNRGSLGVKIVTVSPGNEDKGLPSIYGMYLLFDATTGIPKASIDAQMLTAKRTAATSALASKYLSRKDSDSLLMIGTGALAPHLIQAHCSVRPSVKQVFVWGRNYAKAEGLCHSLQHLEPSIQPVNRIDKVLSEVSIVSCATLSSEPLVSGERLVSGQHLDLVGSYRPEMREADDEAIRRSSVFVDTFEGAPKESGDILIPLENGVLDLNEIKADLPGLCRGDHSGRKDNDEITLFKSVGHAIEDLVAANMVFDSKSPEA